MTVSAVMAMVAPETKATVLKMMSEVAVLCDRIVVVAQGRVVSDGTSEALLEKTGKRSLEEAFVTLVEGEEARP